MIENLMEDSWCSLPDVAEFDGQVFENLKRMGVDFGRKDLTVCAGVSGGADSTSLLVCLCHIGKKYGFKTAVISVNHKIREDYETDGDTEFVRNLCDELKNAGYNLEFEEKVLARGQVFALADQRKNGVEEAARYLRYETFEEFTEKHDSDCFCIAHNKNDQLETLLMRFIQGSRNGAYGIAENRNIFFRPLLSFYRSEIENYLKIQGLSWRTDRTNLETVYLRNRIRLNLMPFLNENFTGWDKAVIAGGKKALIDEDFLQKEGEKFELKSEEDDRVTFNLSDFNFLHEAVKIRVIYRIFNLLKTERRVSFYIVEDLMKILNRLVERTEKSALKSYNTSIYEFDISVDKNAVSIKKHIKTATESGFSVIIYSIGEYDFPAGKVYVEGDNNCFNLIFKTGTGEFRIEGEKLPLCVRSRQPGDTVMTSTGNLKNLSDIFSDWHIPVELKNFIPVIQELYSPEQKIKYIPGGLFGFKNWILKN